MARPSHRILVVVAGLAAMGALCGCGSDTFPVAAPQSATAVTTTAWASRGPGLLPRASRDDRTVTEMTGFTSPSGNIGCIIDPDYVRCDIRDREWSPPPRPADCEYDYGQGIGLSPGRPAAFICAGDTALNAGPPLAYGDKIIAGTLECTSRSSGMSCWDFQYGHEFTLSREGYRLS